MSLTAVRNLTVVSFFVIGGLLICGNIYAGTAPYSNLPYSTIENIWGTTFDDKPGNYNQGHYFAEWSGTGGNPNRDYGEMPQEDTTYIHEINAPFDMSNTSWSATPVDVATQYPLFQTFTPTCMPAAFSGAIYAMNDTDHVYLAIQVEADQINSADRLFLYFDPDNIQPVAQFVEGSGYCVGVKLGDVTFSEGVGNTVNEEMDFCNGHWMDWDNSGSIDTWEYGYPWPYIGAYNAMTYPMENFTGNKDDLTVCPRNASLWGDGGTTYPTSGAYWTSPGALLNGLSPSGDLIEMQFKIPLEHLGCNIALGSSVGFAIKWFDDKTPYDGTITPCTPEIAWWPTDIENSGPPGGASGWDEYDATYMGTMTLNSLNIGNRLWGAWYDIGADRTTYLVLKNVSDSVAKTKVKFYQSLHGDASERWAPLPGAGELILASQCLELQPHEVTTLQLETLDSGLLDGTRGCIEITNVDLAGYVIAYIGLETGALQRYAWSTDLEITPLTPAEWSNVNGITSTGMMLTNKWYIVDEPGWEFDTSIIIVNPNPVNSATASITLYPAQHWNPAMPDTPNLCADVGFHPDFDGDYSGSGECGDDTGDPDDVINLPPHQAVELRMWELLNQWVASADTTDPTSEITNPDNRYWHFRKGTVEIFVQDGDDANTTRVDEALLGITARESANQGWGENLQRYYE